MSLLVFVVFTNGSQALFLWRQELSLESAPKPGPEFVFLLKSHIDCNFSRKQALVQGKAAGQARWGYVKALVFICPSGLWSRGCPSDQVAGAACHNLNLVVFLPLSHGTFVICVIWRNIRPLHPSLLNPEKMLELIKEAHSLWRWSSFEQRNVGHG